MFLTPSGGLNSEVLLYYWYVRLMLHRGIRLGSGWDQIGIGIGQGTRHRHVSPSIQVVILYVKRLSTLCHFLVYCALIISRYEQCRRV